MSCARALTVTTLGEDRRPHAENCTRSTPLPRTAASQFVDETVAHAFQGRLVEASGKNRLSLEFSEDSQCDGPRPTDEGYLEKEASMTASGRSTEYLQRGVQSRPENIVTASGPPTPTEAGTVPTDTALPENAALRSSVFSAESKTMAHECSDEYLQQGLRASLAQIMGVPSDSSIPTVVRTNNTAGTSLAESAGQTSRGFLAELRAMAHECSDEYLQQGLRASLAQIMGVPSDSSIPTVVRTNNTAGTSLAESAGQTSRGFLAELRAMAHECSDEYLQQGLRASLAQIMGVPSESSMPAEVGTNNTAGTSLAESAGQTSRGFLAELRAMAHECSDEYLQQGLRASLAQIMGVPSESSMPAEVGTNNTARTSLAESAGQTSRDFSAESRAMVRECSDEYLQQGLRASLAQIMDVPSDLSIPAEVRTNNTAGTSLAESAGQTSRDFLAETRVMAHECSNKYLQQGLRASLAHIVGAALGSSIPAGARTNNTAEISLPETAGQTSRNLSVELRAMAQESSVEYLQQGLRASLAHILGVASGSSTPTEAGTITAGTTPPETAGRKRGDMAVASKAMAQECSVVYLQQGLPASPGNNIGVDPRSSTPKEVRSNSTTGTTPPEPFGRRNRLIPASAQLGIKDRGCDGAGGSCTTTPLSGFTTPISTDSSSATEFVLNDDAFRNAEEKGSWATLSGSDQVLNHHDIHTGFSTGVYQGFALAREDAVINAAEAAVEGWLFGAVGKSARKAQPATTSETVGKPLAHTSNKMETGGANEDEASSGEHRRSPAAPTQLGLPLGFLNDIVERRASLKPVTTAQITPMEVKIGGGKSEVASRLQREWGVEREARDRAAALLELTALVRAKALDRYDPDDFSREALFGEGRHSVVYRVSATRPWGATGRFEGHPGGRPATKGARLREAAAATMARKVNTAILTAAETGVVSMEVTNLSKAAVAEEITVVAMMAAALVESVIRTSSSAVVVTVTAAASAENDENIGTVLAAKEFRYMRADAPESILRQAHREVCMHLRVSDCVNVVALRGVWVLPRVTILLEPMHEGNLHGFVRARAAEGHERQEGLETRRQRARLVAEAAEGLAALHNAGIVHRDVKSHNVLVVRQRRMAFGGAEPVGVRGCEHGERDQSCTFVDGIDESGWEAKLGDLGSAALIPLKGQAALTEEIGTSGWTAPEVCEGRGYGTPADVFSLGVLIWDAFVCGALENPMCGRSGDQLTGELRPRWPQPPLPVVPSDIERLAERCWVPDPEARPTASAVAAELRAFCCRACVEIGG
ncbi:unnamed protein product [Ectocarpus sp. CCAP 1310/34]|nr:unnamed protein product [Ectocarpus sp. CCAP 1310/34]